MGLHLQLTPAAIANLAVCRLNACMLARPSAWLTLVRMSCIALVGRPEQQQCQCFLTDPAQLDRLACLRPRTFASCSVAVQQGAVHPAAALRVPQTLKP